MKLLRPLVVLVFFLFLFATLLLWWNSPGEVDMASYAPADAYLYLEINSIEDITKAVQKAEVFKIIAPTVGPVGLDSHADSAWSLRAARAGLAPTQLVISSRAQMALVVVGVNTAEKDDSLRIKPEAALIVETKTSKWRMKTSAVENIKKLAQFAYGDAVCTERVSKPDFIDCLEPKGSRKIVGAIEGSLVIIGNSDKAVENCLEVRHGQRPSMQTDPEFVQARQNLNGESALAFGYISRLNAARLVSLATPLLLGKSPGDSQLETLLGNSAAKILRGIAWTSKGVTGGIEDRYQISLEPEVVKRLGPAFDTSESNEDFWKLVPAAFRSLTLYRCKDPQMAWSSLDSALAMKLDAVSSVFIASLIKSGLSGYGIENPREFLAAMSAPLLTLRPTIGEESLLIGRVGNEEQLRRFLAANLLKENKGQILTDLQSEPNREKEFTAVLIDGFLILGKTENILVYLDQVRNKEVVTSEQLNALKIPEHPTPAIVTYTNERSSVTDLISALSRINGRALSEKELDAIQTRLTDLSVSSTETELESSGINRKTRSAFGQFGNLVSLALADSSNSVR